MPRAAVAVAASVAVSAALVEAQSANTSSTGEDLYLLFAAAGFLVLFAGMVGIALPGLLRLQRRLHGLAIVASGFIIFVVTANLHNAAIEERENAERAARLASEQEELRQRREAYEAQRAAIPPPAPQWSLNTDRLGYRSAVKPGNDGQLFVSVRCGDNSATVALTALTVDNDYDLLVNTDVEATWDDGTGDHFQRSAVTESQIQDLLGKLRRRSTVTFDSSNGFMDTIDLSGSATAIDNLDCSAGPTPRPAITYQFGPSSLTAQEFGRTLSWLDMEPKFRFDSRMPAGVVGRPIGLSGDIRRFRYSFPAGGAIILRARPCRGDGSGLCVWSVDVE